MAFPNRFNQRASRSGSTYASIISSNHENTPFDPDDSVVAPSTFARPSPSSDRSQTVLTEMDIDPREAPTHEVIDLTLDDDSPPAAQYPATPSAQANGGGYNSETMNAFGGDYKMATSASSDTGRVAAGSSRSIGKRKSPGGSDEYSVPERATPVTQRTEPSPQEPGRRIDAHTASEIAKLHSMISELQQGQKIHEEDILKLSTRMDTTEDSYNGLNHQLSTRMDEFEKQLKEDAETRKRQRRADVEQRRWAERNHDTRHSVVVALLTQGRGLVNRGVEPRKYSSPTSCQSGVPSSDISEHTSPSLNSALYQSPNRRPGYEDPRNSRPCRDRGKWPKDRLGKTRRDCTPSETTCTPNSTPPRSGYNTPACNSPSGRVTETVHNFKSEPTLYSSTPATRSQNSSFPKGETSSSAPGSIPDNRPKGQSSRTN